MRPGPAGDSPHAAPTAPEGFLGTSGRPPSPRFCADCGSVLAARRHPPEQRERLTCSDCGRIHYQNPIVVASVILERGGTVLLLRRARPPRAGTWVFPGGFVEMGETVAAAATRECIEETGVDPCLGPLLGVYDRPGPGVVVIVYRATPGGGEPHPGHEATELRWFPAHTLPWHDLAFDTTVAALRDWAATIGAA